MPEVALAPQAAPPVAPADSLGGRIDQLYELMESKRVAQAVVNEIEEKYAYIEGLVIADLNDIKIDSARGKTASVAVAHSTVPTVDDWEAFCKYVSRTKYWHLIQQRPAALACRELWEQKSKIPGLTPFTKTKLSLRKV